MDRWEYRFVQVVYVEYEKLPAHWKAHHIHENTGEVSTVLLDVAGEFNSLGDEGWEVMGVVPGGRVVPSVLGKDNLPLTLSTPGATVGPRAGALIIFKRPKQ